MGALSERVCPLEEIWIMFLTRRGAPHDSEALLIGRDAPHGWEALCVLEGALSLGSAGTLCPNLKAKRTSLPPLGRAPPSHHGLQCILLAVAPRFGSTLGSLLLAARPFRIMAYSASASPCNPSAEGLERWGRHSFEGLEGWGCRLPEGAGR